MFGSSMQGQGGHFDSPPPSPRHKYADSDRISQISADSFAALVSDIADY